MHLCGKPSVDDVNLIASSLHSHLTTQSTSEKNLHYQSDIITFLGWVQSDIITFLVPGSSSAFAFESIWKNKPLWIMEPFC